MNDKPRYSIYAITMFLIAQNCITSGVYGFRNKVSLQLLNQIPRARLWCKGPLSRPGEGEVW